MKKRQIPDIAGSMGPEALVDLASGLRLGIVLTRSDGRVIEVNSAAAPVFRPGVNVFSSLAGAQELRDKWDNMPVGAVESIRLNVAVADHRRLLDTVVLRPGGDQYVLVFRDVTLKLDAQEELLRERSFYRSLLGQLGVGLMLLDRELHVLWANDVAQAFLVRTPEAGADKCADLMAGRCESCDDCPAKKALETGEVASGEVGMNHKAHGHRILHIVAAPVRDYRGRVDQVSVVIEDVTEKRNREDEYRRRLEREVELKTRDLEDTNRRLRMLDRMKEEFLANITHELRTPLVTGIGYLELILQGGAGAITKETREGLEISRRNLLRLVGLIEDLLTYTRLSAGREEIVREPVDVARIARECVSDLLIRQAGRRDLQVTLDTDDCPCIAWSDADKIHRVITNLLANSEKFTGETARIVVRVHRRGSGIEVAVEDNGPGIPVEERQAVFEHFHRGAFAVREGKRGAGIGLSLVRQILDAHNSAIEARDSALGGAAMVFTLPTAVAGSPPALQVARRPVAVLIIDNDAEVSGLLRVALEDVGYRVDTAAPESTDIASCIAETNPDVVVLDFNPDGGVFKALEKVRQATPSPIILMCGSCTADQIEQAKAAGASEILRKPFPIAVLTGLVAKVARRSVV